MCRKGAGDVPSGSWRTPMLGIDVSKEELVCTLVDPQTQTPRWTKTVANTAAGVSQLLARTPAETPWVLEPTGRYSLPVVLQAQAAGRRVLMADPKAAHHYLKSRQSRAKTDRLDSRGLALLALDRPLRPYPVKATALEQVDQLLSARRGISEAITRLKQQLKELPHAAGPLQEAIEGLQKQQQALERQIEQRSKQAPELSVVAELRRVHGIGLITATTAASRLSARVFARPDQWVAYLGYDIGVRQSGKRKGEWGLTKQGDAELRRLFYVCAKANLRTKDSPFRAQYERELKKGLKKTAALCAVARKLARLVWSLYRHGSRYDPARVSQPQAA
jgi:transposase